MKNLNFIDHERGGVWHDFCKIKHVNTPSASKSNSIAFEQVKCRGNVIPTLVESPSNHPLITRLSPANHPLLAVFNQVKRVMRAAMVLLMLFVGVGQMWGGSEGSNWYDASSAKVYFDNTNSSYSNVSILIGRQWNYGSDGVGSSGTNLSKISGTNNLYYASVSFTKYTTFCFIDATNWGWEGNKVTARCTYASHYTNTPNDNLGSSTHLYVPASGSNNASVTHTTPASYTALNYTQTLYQCVAENGGTPAKSTASIGTITITTKKLNGNSSTTNSTGTIAAAANNTTAAAARTATVTMTATNIADGYSFLGWYTAETGGTLLESSTTYTYQATAENTVYARFSHETTHSVDITYKCGSTTVSTATSQAIGQVTASSISAPTVAGYTFSSWTLGNGISNQSGSTTANPISVKTKSTGTYTMQANYTEDLSSPWHLLGASTPFGGWSSSSSNMLQKASGSSTGSVASITINVSALPSAEEYTFKLYNATTDKWRTNGGYWVTRANNNPTLSTEGGTNNELIFKPDVIGNYTFSLDYSSANPVLTVTFPTKYIVTYSVSPSGAANAITTSPSVSSGGYVAEGTSVTFTHADAKTGYSWYRWEDGSGSSLGTGSTYTTTINANTTVVAKYTENTYNVTATASTGGSATPASATSMGQITGGDITATPSTGYNFTNWTITSGSGYFGTSGTATTSTTANTKFRPTAAATIQANFTPKQTTITLYNEGATTAGSESVVATYGEAMPAITLPAKDGYRFGGYFGAPNGGGPKYYNADGSSAQNWDNESDTYSLRAYWIANSYTVTFDADEEHKGTIAGATESQNVTYGSATVTVPNLPRAEAGYGFMGYYTEQNGNGSQVINAEGEWIASVSGYTDSDKNWVHADDATLYAYYRKAAISSFTFAGGTNAFAPEADVTVTANLTPQPEGTTIICWRVLYGNGNALNPQPAFSSAGANTVTFAASETSGSYKIEATLRLGSTCESGEVLSTQEIGFQVAGDHTVTLQYKCGDEVIAPSATITGKPLEWSSAIAAPDIFGYTFHHWLAGDGITLSENGTSAKTGARPDSSTVSSIFIKAIYDGRLTAVYTQKNMIYFKNTLGWSDVYVNFYTGSYWNNPKGSGNQNVTNRNKYMTRLGETDIWYYDYGASITPSLYVSFTDAVQNGTGSGNQYFWLGNPGVNVVYPANYQDAIHTDKSSENGFKAATPMFVPLAGQTATVLNNSGGGKANYFNRGYWTKYTPGTGYTLEIYNSSGGSLLKTIEFTAEDDLMPMEATADLEAGTTYKYQIRRGGTGSAGIYYGNSGTMTYANHGVGTGWEMTNAGGMTMAGITTNAAGEYTFHLSYSANASSQYRLRMAVDYPIASGDYRVIYKDNEHTAFKPSAIVPKKNDGKDTVSFFIRPGQSPVMKIQQATVASNGTITWSAGTDISSELTAARCPKDSVYNICLTMNESGAISVENVEAYTGEFYIRTDAANSKWDNYRSFDHMMTYSEYSEKNSNFTHYWMAHVSGSTNVKFVVANDYSPCISDTLVQGDDAAHVNASGNISVEANIRFMWHRHTNSVNRAYLAPAQNDGSKFLVLRGTNSDNLLSAEGEPLRNGNNHGAPSYSMQFDDDENWIYETTVQVKPSTFVKLYAYFHGSTFYYRGKNNDNWDAENAITLITGEDADPVRVRVIYDFKTDRLLAAWLPEGNISEEKDIHADVMFIREHQGDISQLTFSGEGKITDIYSAYAVMKFNKWTLNNKHKDTHAPLASPASVYERSLYWVSFPFRVKLNDVFGFGKYMQHWAIQKYNGARRAAEGFWAESSGFWEWMDNNTEYLEPNQGYLLALDLDLLGEDSPIWDNEVQNIELFFPSYGTMPDITSAEVVQTIPEHACTINRAATEGLPDTGDPRTSYNRTVFDSHWNVLSVPTYVNTENIAFANTTWTSSFGPRFLYTWNSNDNTLTATVASGYKYHAMHSYFVQYGGGVTWTASSGSPYSIVARRTYSEEPAAVNFCLEVQQNEEMVDRTYIQLSADEEVSNNFVFGEDMTKEFNSRNVNIYTIVENMAVAGNTQPMSNQTTVVPVGVETKSGGEYTFAMPAGTEGIGVILVDNEAGTRTNLSLTDYTVTLNTGKNDSRFVLEISPIAQSPTDIENVQGDNAENTKARKALVDGILYIVKDGKVFDARGGRVD